MNKKLLVKKQCLNECSRKVMLKRNESGITPAEECGTCKTLGADKSKAEFNRIKSKTGKIK